MTSAWARSSSIRRSRADMTGPYSIRVLAGPLRRRVRSPPASSSRSAWGCSPTTRRRPRRSAQRGRDRRPATPPRAADPSPDQERAREAGARRRRARPSTTPTTSCSPRSRRSPSRTATSKWARRGVPGAARPARVRLRPRLPRALRARAPLTRRRPRGSALRRGAADFALGVEEELLLVDPATPRAGRTRRERDPRRARRPGRPRARRSRTRTRRWSSSPSPVVPRRPRPRRGRSPRCARVVRDAGGDRASAPASTPPAAFGDVRALSGRALRGDPSPAARAHAPHADRRASHVHVGDARRRDGDPRAATGCASTCRCCRRWPRTRRSGTASTPACECARRAAVPRPTRARTSRRAFAVLRRLRATSTAVVARRRPRGLHVPVVGPAPAPAARARSRCARWTPSRRCGASPALAALVHGLRRARPARRRGDRARAARGAHGVELPRRPRRPGATLCSTDALRPVRRGRARDARPRAPDARDLGDAGALEAVERILRRGQRRRPPARGVRARRDARRCSSCWSRRRRRPTRRRRRGRPCRHPVEDRDGVGDRARAGSRGWRCRSGTDG